MRQQTLPPTALAIFGITGNLAQQKLVPALYHLEAADLLPEKFVIIGIFHSRTDLDAVFREAEMEILREHQEVNPDILAKLREYIVTIQMDSTDPADFKKLAALLKHQDELHKTKFNHLFYLAIPPDIFLKVIDNLASAGLNKPEPGCESRLLVEKPFGNDLASAQSLIAHMSKHFNEAQVYRIDHYLAKETAQNILTFRFNNPLIEGIWSRQYIDHIQITAAEKIGIQGRVAFYEGIGALRDIVQSHLLQLMALVMMENPESLSAHAVHQEKLRLLESVEPILPQQVEEVAVRGQYDGYKEEVHNPHSTVETYAAVKLAVANSRWGGVPVLLRTGKELTDKTTEISVVFSDHLHQASDDNLLVIRIQPNEGISLKLQAKTPGFSHKLQAVQMDFDYQSAFGSEAPSAYERVLDDAMRGDQTLFASGDEVLASWKLLQPILDAWQTSHAAPASYPKGSWGPKASETLAENYGCHWLNYQSVVETAPQTEARSIRLDTTDN